MFFKLYTHIEQNKTHVNVSLPLTDIKLTVRNTFLIINYNVEFDYSKSNDYSMLGFFVHCMAFITVNNKLAS